MKVLPPDDASHGPVITQRSADDRGGPRRKKRARAHARPGSQRPVGALLALLFVVPLASLLALWGFAANVTLSNAIQAHNFNTEDGLFGAGAQAVVTQLAQERLQAFEWLSGGGVAAKQPMLAQWRATDAAVSSFRRGVNANPGLIEPSARPALQNAFAVLGQLGGIRAAVSSRRITALAAFQAYNAIVDAQFRMFSDLVLVNDTPVYQQAVASIAAGRAVEMASREVALVAGAFAAGDHMSTAERVLFAQTVATQRLLIGDAFAELNPSLSSGYRSAYASPAYASFAAIENQIVASIGSKAPIPVNPLMFGAATIPLFKDFQSAQARNRVLLSALGTTTGNRLLVEVLVAGGLGLVAVVLSVFLMVRFGRRISRELTGLQRSALELATDRLPEVVERLSHGEEVDVAAEAAAPPAGRIAEITKVAVAFSSVQSTAVEAAVGQARLRRGVSQVFRNLAWRSQSLLHRQLALLDTMERRSEDPDTLAELFQLDHLTTRMRRHAEGLIILSGAAPGRGWRIPVPVIDVLRGAIAEVEDYTRVKVITRSADAVAGSAVADVIHLLAELIENATTCSPANTEVTVKADRVANGFVVEVEDRGIGISEDQLARINDRLANPPEFDLADSDRLGLFVVARLAAKHRIKIVLRPSPYGGTTAIVLLPRAIVVTHDAPDAGRKAEFSARPLAALGVQAGAGAEEAETWADGPGAAWRAAEPPVAGSPAAGLPVPGLPVPGLPVPGLPVPGLPVAGSPVAGLPVAGSPVAGPPVAGPPVAGSPVAESGLPRRVRQASLAPQLKNGSGPPTGEAPPAASGRSPAETRSFIEALQQGWLLARSEADPLDDPGPVGSPEQAAVAEDLEGM
jgi:signal transduction histidine kinase